MEVSLPSFILGFWFGVACLGVSVATKNRSAAETFMTLALVVTHIVAAAELKNPQLILASAVFCMSALIALVRYRNPSVALGICGVATIPLGLLLLSTMPF